MQTLAKVVQKGWPDTRNEVPVSIRSYWEFMDENTTGWLDIQRGTSGYTTKDAKANVSKGSCKPPRPRGIHKTSKGCDILARNDIRNTSNGGAMYNL